MLANSFSECTVLGPRCFHAMRVVGFNASTFDEERDVKRSYSRFRD